MIRLTEIASGVRTKNGNGAKKLSSSERKILDYVVQKGIKGQEAKLSERPAFFRSSHRGVKLEVKDGNTYYLIYEPGRVSGIDNQKVDAIFLTRNGSSDIVFRVTPDDFKRKPGQLMVEPKHAGEAARKLRSFLSKIELSN